MKTRVCQNSTERHVPEGLLDALVSCSLKYTVPDFIYYLVWGWGDEACGVFGDGPNGSYEWFIWRDNKLQTSNDGYGSLHVALRDVLNIFDPAVART